MQNHRQPPQLTTLPEQFNSSQTGILSPQHNSPVIRISSRQESRHITDHPASNNDRFDS